MREGMGILRVEVECCDEKRDPISTCVTKTTNEEWFRSMTDGADGTGIMGAVFSEGGWYGGVLVGAGGLMNGWRVGLARILRLACFQDGQGWARSAAPAFTGWPVWVSGIHFIV